MNFFNRLSEVSNRLKTAVSRLYRQAEREQRVSTLVITSINPFSKLAHQLNCFNRWIDIGYNIQSYNSRQEYEQLLSNGLGVKNLQKINRDQTAIELFNSHAPRILPVLEHALLVDYDFYILANSDIYPAHESVASKYFAGLSESIAFTRAECPDLSLNTYEPQNYYRGGLDVFWFTKRRLQKVVSMLKKISVSERMTFGVPGWDFFLGHLICKELDSPIIDGSIFLHQSHKDTYADFDEFDHYLTEMKKSGHYTSRDYVALAHEFYLFIEQECKDNENIAQSLEEEFYTQPTVDSGE